MTLLLKETTEARILRIADALQPEIRRTFLAAVDAFKGSIPVGDLTELLEEGDLTEALDQSFSVFDELQGKLKEDLKEALIEVVEQAALPTVAEFGLDFSVVSERAVRFATEQAGRLIVEIGAETQRAVADIVSVGLRQGVAPRQQALLIREVVGLTRRDALAVDRFLQGAIDSGLTRAQAQDQAERMARRLLLRRAENIARTETIRASNMGTQLGWDAAQDAGLLPPGTQKVWIATEDSRTCPICAVLDGNTVDLGGSFDVQVEATSFTIEGDEIRVSGTRALKRPSTTKTPPAHPSCRCTIGVVLTEGGEVVPQQPPVTSWDEAMKASRDWNPEDMPDVHAREGIMQNEIIEDWTNGKIVKGMRKSQVTGKGVAGLNWAERLTVALEGAPRYEGKLYRGIDLAMDDAQTLLNKLERAKDTGAFHTTSAFGSYSTSRRVGTIFAEGEVGVVFNIEKSVSGRALGRFSLKPAGGILEKEVVMSKGTQFKVIDVDWTPRKVKSDLGSDFWVYDVFMEEVPGL